MKKEIYVKRRLWGTGVELHIGIRRSDHLLDVLRPGPMEKIDEGADLGEPALSFANDEAQRLMDELWHCGFRPSEGSGSAGSLAATERHLADMKAIAKGALKKIGIES